MAKVNIAITDRAAPVEVWLPGRDEPSKVFAGMDAFEAWYKPSIGRCLHGQSSANATAIMLEELNEPKSKPAFRATNLVNPVDPKLNGANGKPVKLLQKITGTFGPSPKSPPDPRPAIAFTKGIKPHNNEGLAERIATTRVGALVTVNGEEHASVKAAFEALGLPMGKRYKFRKELKAAGSKTFSHEGKDYQFKTGGV